MKRIGTFCGTGIFSGKEVVTLELAEGLRDRGGYQLDVVGSHWGSGNLPRRLRAAGFPVHDVWLGFISATLRLDCLCDTSAQILRWPQLLMGYRRFLRRISPERMVHTNWQHLLLLWPFLKPERDLFWLHEVVPNKPQYRCVFGWLARRIACFVCVSNVVARSLADIGIVPNKICVIYNGLKAPVPTGAPRNTIKDCLRVGIIGQVGPWKGHEDLLEAFASVAKSHPTAELHLFGRGSDAYERQLKQRVAAFGIADKIAWHGFVADRNEIYLNIDICAIPSRSNDPLPTVAIEAAFFGLPIVASLRGGLPEIVEDGVTGFLVEAQDPQRLAARLDELLKSPELRSKMGQAARRRAEMHFSRERFVEDFVRLLDYAPRIN